MLSDFTPFQFLSIFLVRSYFMAKYNRGILNAALHKEIPNFQLCDLIVILRLLIPIM